MQIRCPHCQNPIELVRDEQFAETTCPQCGSTFGLADDPYATASWHPESTIIGGYELVEPLGNGHFGTVWKARDTSLDRSVAVKIPRRGTVSPREAEQFLREARAAAQLNHPNIVSVHEVGRHDDCVYIVSELIDGCDLSQWLTGQQLTPREAAELCARIAVALQHAHEAGVVHRDLKPANILLDAEGEPHIADFGLAKREAGEITMTIEGQILGTPAYMSPEQAKGEGHQADRRSDIWSLGVILFELLTGERPFRGKTRMLIVQILNEDPPHPRKLNGRIPLDLATICLKCLEREPDKRYQTAQQLADDLRRWLQGAPISARPVGQVERTWRWCRRNPALASLSAAVFLAMLGGTIVSSLFAASATAEKHRADLEAGLARRSEVVALDEKARADQEAAAARVAQLEAEEQLDRQQRILYAAQLREVDSLWQTNPPLALTTLEDDERCPEHLRDFTWGYYDRLSRRALRTMDGRHAQSVSALAFTPDGRIVASGGADGAVKVWHIATGKELLSIQGPGGWIDAVAFAPDGKTLAFSGGNQIKRWNIQSEQEIGTWINEAGKVSALEYSPRGETLAAASGSGITLWSVATGESQHVLRGSQAHPAVHCLAFSSDGKTLASGHGKWVDPGQGKFPGEIALWDLESAEERATFQAHDDLVYALDFSADGKTLISASRDGEAKRWDSQTGVLLGIVYRYSGDYVPAAVQEKQILLGGRTVKFWDDETATGLSIEHRFGGVLWAHRLAFSPIGNQWASGGTDGAVRIWSNLEIEPVVLTGHTGNIYSVAFSPDGRTMAAASGNSGRPDQPGEVKLWNLDNHQERATLDQRMGGFYSVDFSPDGETLVSGSALGFVTLYDAASAEQKAGWMAHLGWVRCVRFSPDGRTIASGGADQTVRLWDVEGNEELHMLEGQLGWVTCLAFSPDGKLLASGSTGAKEGEELREVKLWDTATGEELATFRGHTDRIFALDFSPDGKTLASGAFDNTVFLWDVASRRRRLTLRSDLRWVKVVAFSSDGKTLAIGATANDSGTVERAEVRLFDPVTGQELARIPAHEDFITALAFGPDSRILASGSNDSTIKLWLGDARE